MAILLRPGKTPSGPEVRTLPKYLVRRTRRNWPYTRIAFRGDSHYGRAEAMAHSNRTATAWGAELTAGRSLDPGNYVTDRKSLTRPCLRQAHPATEGSAR